VAGFASSPPAFPDPVDPDCSLPCFRASSDPSPFPCFASFRASRAAFFAAFALSFCSFFSSFAASSSSPWSAFFAHPGTPFCACSRITRPIVACACCGSFPLSCSQHSTTSDGCVAVAAQAASTSPSPPRSPLPLPSFGAPSSASSHSSTGPSSVVASSVVLPASPSVVVLVSPVASID